MAKEDIMSLNEEILQNRAVPAQDTSGNPVFEEKTCECCDDPLLFAMRDNYRDFSVGLFTILQCLRLAEKEGHVPTLSESWWVQLAIRYNLKL